MFVGIITLVGSIAGGMLLAYGILAAISLNPKVVNWYTKRAMKQLSRVVADFERVTGDLETEMKQFQEGK